MSDNDEHLASMFWGDGGEYVVVRGGDVYGPFHNADVAHIWSRDMEMVGGRILKIQPPPKPPQHKPGNKEDAWKGTSVGACSTVRSGP